MWRSLNEEWERRKSYLVQSLFEDVSKLSPIAESNEPDNLSTANNSVNRAHSPLPDLIIEREKNRHDESDEFYRQLEVKMIKLYKKLFHGLEDDSSEETYKLIESGDDYDHSFLEQNVSEVDISQHNLILDSSTSVSNISDTSRSNEAIDAAYETSREPQESNGVTESESSLSITHEVIVTRAIVHREPANDDREDFNNNIVAYQVSSPIFNVRSPILMTGQKQADSDRLVVTQAKTDQDIKIESKDDEDEEYVVEVMRLGTRKMYSLGSIPEETTPSEESVTPIALAEGRMSHVRNVDSSPETDFQSVTPIAVVEGRMSHVQNVQSSSETDFERVTPFAFAEGHMSHVRNVESSPETDFQSVTPIAVTDRRMSYVRNVESLPETNLERVTPIAVTERRMSNVQNVQSWPKTDLESVTPIVVAEERMSYVQNVQSSPETDLECVTPIAVTERRMSNVQNVQSWPETDLESVTPIAVAEGRMSHVRNVESSPETDFSKSNYSASKRSSSTVSGDSPNKKKSYETVSVSVQTDPVNRKVNWDEVRGNFFRGTPTIYNLCRCRNHKC